MQSNSEKIGLKCKQSLSNATAEGSENVGFADLDGKQHATKRETGNGCLKNFDLRV